MASENREEEKEEKQPKKPEWFLKGSAEGFRFERFVILNYHFLYSVGSG